MNLDSVNRWAELWADIGLVMPELFLIVAMCAVVLAPLVKREQRGLSVGAAVLGLVLALLSAVDLLGDGESLGPVFHGALVVDHFSQFFKVLLYFFTLMVVGLWWLTSQGGGAIGRSDARERSALGDTPDFLCLLLGATVGMSLMASAANLVTIFVAMETASIPSFALAGFRKKNLVGTEGSLKYVLFGAASSAIMLYGMSLIYGACGTLDLAGIASVAATGIGPMLAVGLLAMFTGFAFKLSAVPMHFWCPDVFEGAPIEVTTFLSVASKGAAIALTLRVLYAFSEMAPTGSDIFIGLAVAIGTLGAVTAIWGNLVAMHQTRIKRLLAYSSIAHAGYMLMAASVMVVSDRTWDMQETVASRTISGAILFYLLIYLFMNLGAFTVAALISQGGGSEDIRSYAGLNKRSPWLAGSMALFLLSLFGMPGLGGFWGKVFLMRSMAEVGVGGFVLIAVLLLNTLISLYYYLRPVYYMYLTPSDDDRPAPLPHGIGLAIVLLCAFVVIWTGILPGRAEEMSRDYAGTMTTARGRPLAASIDGFSPSTLILEDGIEESVRLVATD